MGDDAPKGLPKRGAIVSVRLATGEKVKPHHHVPSTWPAPVRGIAALSRILAVLEGVGIGACLLAVVGLATWQFIERNLTQHHLPFFHVPPWTDGVIRHSVFMLGFLGGAYATYTGRHIRIDAVTRVVKSKKRMALRVLTTLVAIVHRRPVRQGGATASTGSRCRRRARRRRRRSCSRRRAAP